MGEEICAQLAGVITLWERVLPSGVRGGGGARPRGEPRGWVGVVPDRSLGLVVDLSY